MKRLHELIEEYNKLYNAISENANEIICSKLNLKRFTSKDIVTMNYPAIKVSRRYRPREKIELVHLTGEYSKLKELAVEIDGKSGEAIEVHITLDFDTYKVTWSSNKHYNLSHSHMTAFLIIQILPIVMNLYEDAINEYIENVKKINHKIYNILKEYKEDVVWNISNKVTSKRPKND